MPQSQSPHEKIADAYFPAWPVILGVSAVCIMLMLILKFSSGNLSLFYWLNGLSRYTGAPLWANVTLLGEGLLGVALLAPISRWRRDIAWSLLVSALFTLLVVHGAKDIFDMPRPLKVLSASDVIVIGPALSVVSFPSGHTTTITVLAAVLALQLNRGYLYFAAILVILLVGFSRVVVGAHWPVDVLGGMLLGWWLSLAGIWVARRFPFGIERNWQTGLCLFSLLGAFLFWGAQTGQHQAVLLQRSSALLAGVLGLVALADLWWPRKNRRA